MKFINKQITENEFKGILYENPSNKDIKYIWGLASDENKNVFFSWIWIESWIHILRDNFDLNLFVIYKGDEVTGCVFLNIVNQYRHKYIKSNQIYLNEMNVSGYNMAFEYNGVLVKSDHKSQAYQLLAKYLLDEDCWDELVLDAMVIEDFRELAQHFNYETVIDKRESSRQALFDLDHCLDKEHFRRSILSRNKRTQINRSIKMIEQEHGDVHISVADNIEQALLYFKNLEVLHTAYWKSKGQTGVFKNSNWVTFHKRIIKNGMVNENIQLIHIHCNRYTIGYLYNLVFDNVVYNIQSGFNYTDDNRFKPGYLSHWLVIEYNRKKGIAMYDFLAGNEDYKKSLSNHEIPLVWASIQRPKISFTVERNLKKIKHYLSL